MKHTTRRAIVLFAVVVLGLLAFTLVNAQENASEDETCPGLIYDAIAQTNDLCGSTARNEACYGHQNVDASLRAAEVRFDAPGDIATLAAIERIQTQPLDTGLAQFGIVLLRAQAGLPDSLPGQNVTMLLMGDVTVQDESADMEGMQPMQAFVFTPGVGVSRCETLDYDSIAIQSPDNVTVNLFVNGAEIELSSTAVLLATEAELDMLIVEGQGSIRTAEGAQTVSAGEWSQVALDESRAVGAPAAPSAFPPERIAHLPLALLDAGRNLALGKPVTASNAMETDPPENAVNGLATGGDNWNAGDHEPPQWIEIDLEREYPVAAIRAFTSQFPPEPFDPTVHEIYVAGEDGNLRLVHTFREATQDDQWLEFRPDVPLMGVRYVRVRTTSTIHWVSWGEIEVIGEGFGGCVVSADATVNLRGGASTDAEQVGTLAAGEQRFVNGQTQDDQGFTWWHLRGGAWVREDVVREDGACSTVPGMPSE